MEKHDLITIMSPNYQEFGQLFLTSCIESGCINDFDHIYIYYTGKTFPSLDISYDINKIKFLYTDESISSKSLHDRSWRKITNSKTSILQTHLLNHCTNTVLIDIDSYFISSFAYLLEEPFDLAVCKRDQSQNHGYIGSFLIANYTNRTLTFISNWIKEIDRLNDKYVESKALTNVLQYSTNENIAEYPESIVSALTTEGNTRILHLKSRPGYETVEDRLGLINNLKARTNV